jgi:hypothetical protein
VVESVGEAPDKLDAVVEKGTRRWIVYLESSDCDRKEVDKSSNETMLIPQDLYRVHLGCLNVL